MVPGERIELPTNGLQNRCSTAELTRLFRNLAFLRSVRTQFCVAGETCRKPDAAGAVPGTKPVVYVIDSHRKPGETLDSYEVLGEVPGNAPRCFAVRAFL